MNDKRIEDTFNEILTGDVLKDALGFARFLSANEIIQADRHSMHYNGKCVCYIDVFGDTQSWTVWTAGYYGKEFKDFPISEPTKEIARTHANKCGNCDGMDCSPGITRIIFEKEFTNICNGADVDMVFENPSGEDMECLKKLVEMRKTIIAKEHE